MQNNHSFLDEFSEMQDPRLDRKKLYPLIEIIFSLFVPLYPDLIILPKWGFLERQISIGFVSFCRSKIAYHHMMPLGISSRDLILSNAK